MMAGKAMQSLASCSRLSGAWGLDWVRGNIKGGGKVSMEGGWEQCAHHAASR